MNLPTYDSLCVSARHQLYDLLGDGWAESRMAEVGRELIDTSPWVFGTTGLVIRPRRVVEFFPMTNPTEGAASMYVRATEKQLSFIESLADERDITTARRCAIREHCRETRAGYGEMRGYSRQGASELISVLLSLPKRVS